MKIKKRERWERWRGRETVTKEGKREGEGDL